MSHTKVLLKHKKQVNAKKLTESNQATTEGQVG